MCHTNRISCELCFNIHYLLPTSSFLLPTCLKVIYYEWTAARGYASFSSNRALAWLSISLMRFNWFTSLAPGS